MQIFQFSSTSGCEEDADLPGLASQSSVKPQCGLRSSGHHLSRQRQQLAGNEFERIRDSDIIVRPAIMPMVGQALKSTLAGARQGSYSD
jgi:hypothetical protein